MNSAGGSTSGPVPSGAIDTLTNNGVLSGALYGIMNESGVITSVINNGNITASQVGIVGLGGSIGTVTNNATVSGGVDGVVNEIATMNTLVNNGNITGGTNAIFNFDGSIGTLDNEGTISGGVNAIKSSLGSLGTIENSGVISGNVDILDQSTITILGGTGSTVGVMTGGTFSITDADGNAGTVVFDGGNETISDDIFGVVDIEQGSVAITGNISGGAIGVKSESAGGSMAISGVITGSSTGVLNDVATTALTNNGVITGTALYGIDNISTIGDLENLSGGTIIGGEYGIYNTGTIGDLTNDSGATISGGIAGIYNTGSIGTLTNNGNIIDTNPTDPGIDNVGGVIAALNNSGTISAPVAIASTGGGLGPIANMGLISGNIDIAGQNVTISGASGDAFGTISGSSFDVDAGDSIDFVSGNEMVEDNITGNVVVAAPARLLANGTVQGNVSVQGGTYEEDIAGLTQAGAATPIGTAGTYNFLKVTNGTFAIAPGSSLAVQLLDNYKPAAGSSFTIVTADDVAGSFSTVSAQGLARGTKLDAVYNPDSIVLSVVSLPAFVTYANDENGHSAGHALDLMNALSDPTDSQNQLLNTAYSLPTSQLPSFLSELDGQIYAANVAVAQQAGQQLEDSVFNRLGEVSRDPTAGRLVWGNVTTQFSSRGSDGISGGLSSNVTQVVVGADLVAQGAARLGLGYAHGSINVESAGSASGQENAGFIYGQLPVGRFMIDGIGGYGGISTDFQRANPLTGAPLTANAVGGGDGLVSLGVSRPMEDGALGLAPYVRVTWQQVSQGGASEDPSSAAALNVDSFAGTGVRGVVGLSGGSAVSSPLAAPVTYRFNAGIGADAGNLTNPSVSASLAGIDTSIATPRVSATFVQASVSGTLRVDRGAYAYASLFGEARGNETVGGISGGLRIQF